MTIIPKSCLLEKFIEEENPGQLDDQNSSGNWPMHLFVISVFSSGHCEIDLSLMSVNASTLMLFEFYISKQLRTVFLIENLLCSIVHVVFYYAAANSGQRWPCEDYKVCMQHNSDSKVISCFVTCPVD